MLKFHLNVTSVTVQLLVLFRLVKLIMGNCC